jgi:hypothetical protein
VFIQEGEYRLIGLLQGRLEALFAVAAPEEGGSDLLGEAVGKLLDHLPGRLGGE